MLWFVFSMLLGCSQRHYIKRLDNKEYDHWRALRVFMDKGERKAYLKGKTKKDRDAYLKKAGLWDRFYTYEQNIRDKIVALEVQEGWTRGMLLMSWGKPIETRPQLQTSAVKAYWCEYKFEVHKDNELLVWEPGSKTEYKAKRFFRREVLLENHGNIDPSQDRIVKIVDR